MATSKSNRHGWDRAGHRAAALALAVAAMAAGTVDAGSVGPPGERWLMPFDVGQKHRGDPAPLQPTQEQVYEFAWDSFIALNWPWLATTPTGQQGMRGQPDTAAGPVPIFGSGNASGTSPLVVWETYMVPGDVFVDPVGWNVTWSTPGFANLDDGFRELRPPGYNGQFAPGINQPYTHANVPTGPAVDQNRNYLRYEVTLNQTYFNYIATFGYFSADAQKAAVRKFIRYAWDNGEAPPPGDPAYFQALPTGTEPYVLAQPAYAQQGLVEVKAAWRVLRTDGPNPDIVERYFRRMMKMSLPDGTYETRLAGLVGFHIHRVTPNGHLPSTFEHVDNVELFRVPDDPLPLPKTPSLNPGRRHAHGWSRGPARYPNGYEVEGLTGQPGIIPKAFTVGATVPPVDQRRRINVSRATPIPLAVQRINRRYQARLRDTVWRYYQLVGTQNKSGTRNNPYVDGENPYLGPGVPNRDLGPGVPGPQFSNTTSLVNTTLESYTQPGFSCAGCHINAFPHGVEAFPPFEARFTPLHVMSFLLLNALPAQSCDGSRHCSTQASGSGADRAR